MNPTNYLNRQWVDVDGCGKHIINMNAKYCRHCKVSYFSIDDVNALRGLVGLGQAKYFWAHACKDIQELKQIVELGESGGKEYQSKRVDWNAFSKKAEDKLKQLPFFQPEDTKRVNLTKDGKDRVVYVYGVNCHCSSCRDIYGFDTIRPRKVDLETVTRGTVTLPVQFCLGCGRYFMNKEHFKKYSKLYGLLIEIRFEDDTFGSDGFFSLFSPDSIFSRCGYSVRQGEPSVKRQAILKFIISSGRAAPYEFLEFADRQISIRLNQREMKGAIDRWREDMDYVNQFTTEDLQSDGKAHLVQGGPFKIT